MTRKFKIISGGMVESQGSSDNQHELARSAYRVLRLMGMRKGSEFTVSTTPPRNDRDVVKMVNLTPSYDDKIWWSDDQSYVTLVQGRAITFDLCHSALCDEFNSPPQTLFVQHAA